MLTGHTLGFLRGRLREADIERLGALRFRQKADETLAFFAEGVTIPLDRRSKGSMTSVAALLVFSTFHTPRTKPSIRNVALTLAAERKTFLWCSSEITRPLSAWESTRLS